MISGSDKTSLGTIAELSSNGQYSAKRAYEDTPRNRIIRRRFKLLNAASRLLPGERLALCMKKIAPEHVNVELVRTKDQESAMFRHLIVCESYSCPVCAYWRSEKDRKELSIALAQAQKMHMTTILVTCTLSHHWNDRLETVMSAVKRVFDATFSGRWYQDIKEDWGIAGKISSWETTIGENGWHPHRHVLFFCSRELTASQVAHFSELLKERWIEKAKCLGFTASYEHGMDIKTADSAIADYIAKFGREPLEKKWSAEHEIAMSPAKRAGLEGMTPFDLLSAAASEQADVLRLSRLMRCQDYEKVRAMAGWLYKEYFAAFKGKARIHWGDMRKVLDLDEAIEEYNLENPEIEKEKEMLAVIPADTWKRIADAEDDMRSELLIFARSADRAGLVKWFLRRNLSADIKLQAETSAPVSSKQLSVLERSKFVWH